MLCVQEEQSLMMPTSGEDEVMQIQEVLIILGKDGHSRRRRMLLKINDLSYMAFVNLKSIESTIYAFYATGNGQVLN
jgi:hypothetical protein